LIVEAWQVVCIVSAFAGAGPDGICRDTILAFQANRVPALCAGVHGRDGRHTWSICEGFRHGKRYEYRRYIEQDAHPSLSACYRVRHDFGKKLEQVEKVAFNVTSTWMQHALLYNLSHIAFAILATLREIAQCTLAFTVPQTVVPAYLETLITMYQAPMGLSRRCGSS
jgi:hypothetical protein